MLALMPDRPGNARRRQLVADTKTEGCSALERDAHQQLVQAGITDWVANRWHRFGGRRLRPDIRILHRKLILEFDGFAFHHDRLTFDRDRLRNNEIRLDDFLLLQFTHPMVRDGSFLRQVRRGLELAPPY